jgi:hypothetical protein
MLALLALTALHGLSMMTFWEDWMRALARAIGDSGRLLWSFSLGLLACLAAVAGAYALLAAATRRLSGSRLPFKRFLATFAFVALPLAFAYHMAHNLNHLVRESAGVEPRSAKPAGNVDALPFSMAEKQVRHMNMLTWQDTIFALQAGLLATGISDRRAHRAPARRGAAGSGAGRAGLAALPHAAVRRRHVRLQPLVADAADGDAPVNTGENGWIAARSSSRHFATRAKNS